MDFDFYSPFVAAAILAEDGTRYPLWTGSQGDAYTDTGNYLGHTESLAYLQEITVEQELGHLPVITATLSPPFHDLWMFLSSELMNWGSTRLQVQFGYTGGSPSGIALGSVFEGILMQPDVSLGTDASISLKAQGVGFSMTRQQSGRTFNNKTRAEIITEVVGGPRTLSAAQAAFEDIGLVAQPSRSSIGSLNALSSVLGLGQPQIRRLKPDFKEVIRDKNRAGSTTVASASRVSGKVAQLIGLEVKGGMDVSPYSLMFEEKVTTNQGFHSDWLFVWSLVRQARCTMLVQGGNLQIFPTSLWKTSTPKRTLYLYHYPHGRVGPLHKSLPITSLSSPTVAVYLPGSVRGIVQRDIDSDSRATVQASHNDETIKPASTGNNASQPPNTEEYPGVNELGDGASYAPGSPLDPKARAQARAEFEAQKSGMGVSVEVETLLDPEVVPGDVVSLYGVSQYHDQNYGILKVNYTAGLGGSTMALSLVSDVTKLAVQAYLPELMPRGETGSPASGGSVEEEAAATVESPPSTDPSAEATELINMRKGASVLGGL